MPTTENQNNPPVTSETADVVVESSEEEKLSSSDEFPLFEGINEYDSFLVDVPSVGVITKGPDIMVAMTSRANEILRKFREWEKSLQT